MDEDTLAEPAGSTHHTFILRCWVGEGQQVRGRLIDVTTGRSQLLGDLAGLVPILKQLMLEPPACVDVQP